MKFKTIIIAMIALLSVGIEAKTYKTIKSPVAMVCVNVSDGELKYGDDRTFHDGIRERTSFPLR